jgi:DNA repair protein RadC
VTSTPSSTSLDQVSLFQTLPARPRALAERPLKEWPAGEHPQARLERLGPTALSDSELLALALGNTGSQHPVTLAESLLADHGGLNGLSRQSVAELVTAPGMTRLRGVRLAAVLELGRRLSIAKPSDRMQVRSPNDAAQLIRAAIGHCDQEHLVALLLDTKNRVIKLHTVYIGTLNSSTVRVGEVFKEGVRLNAASLIVGHNHPSQDVTPSPEDVLVTRRIVDAGKLMDIEVHDHIVCSATSFVSMRERGLGFKK